MNKPDILKVNRKNWVSILSLIALLLGLLYFGAPVWIPLVFSFFLFMLLDPIVDGFERRGFSGTFVSLLLVIASVVLTTGVLWVGYVSVSKIAMNVPRYETRFEELKERLFRPRDEFQRDLLHGPGPLNPDRPPVQKVEVVEKPTAFFFSSPIWSGVNSALGLISVIFFIPIIALVMLWERRALVSRFEQLFHHPEVFHRTCTQLRRMTYGFFFGNFIVGAGTAVLFASLYAALGLEDFLVYGFTSGFLNLLPVFGPLIGASLPVMQALIQFPAAWPAWLILAVSILVHFLSANLLIPKFIGGRVNLNATAGTIGLLVWGALWGVTGLFLAIPLMATIRIILEIYPSTQRFAGILEELEEVPIETIEVPPPGPGGIHFTSPTGKA